VSSHDSIPECEVLSIVVLEIRMMDSVMISSVDDITIVKSLSIMDRNSPSTHQKEEGKIQVLIKRYEVSENVIGKRLSESVCRMESKGSKWSRNDPFVMQLVDWVERRKVDSPMNPIDHGIGENKIERNRKDCISPSRDTIDSFIKSAVSTDFTNKDKC